MNTLNRQLIAHLTTTRNWCSAYHNHKENSAWAAIALFVAVAGGSIGLTGVVTTGEHKLALVGAVLAGAVLVHFFVRRQNRLRHLSFEMEAACDRLISRVLAGHRFGPDDCGPGDDLPELAVLENAFRFPKCLLRAMCEIRQKRRDVRGGLLLIGYLLLWLAALATAYLAGPDIGITLR